MATIVVAGVGAYLAAGTTSATTAAILAAATAAAAIGAAYIDSKYVYPKLFPSDDPQQPNVSGIDTMTGQDGSPGHTSWGRFALVGGHVLWFENYAFVENQVTNKKGGGATVTKRIADVGIGLTRNLIAGVEQVFADQKVLWRRDPNNVLWADYRCTIALVTYDTTNDAIRIAPTTAVQDFGPIFRQGDVVLMTGNTASGQNGYWRVRDYRASGDPLWPFGALWLKPLSGQTPANGGAGTSVAPIELRRIDAAIIDYTNQFLGIVNTLTTSLTSEVTTGSTADLNQDSHYWRRMGDVLVPGTLLRFENFSNAVNGLWEVTGVQRSNTGTTWKDIIGLQPRSGQAIVVPTHSSPTNVGRILFAFEEGFLDPKYLDLPPNQQALPIFLGTEDEGPDPTLLAVYGSGNVHGYRGLARLTLPKLNLSNWGDRVPQISAAVRVAHHQSTHDVIRFLMREAFRGDDSWYDLSGLEADQVLGYTRRGQQQTSTTIQPLAIAYGIEAQERGSTWAFFKGKDADLHQLAESDLGAYVGRDTQRPGAFQHQRIQDRDLPRRLSFYYRDPLNDFTRSEKLQRAAAPDDASDEEVAVDVDPLVLYPWDAQVACDRLFAQALVGRDQGSITVPPSRMDILPNDRVTFTALNWNEELVEPVSDAIDHQTQITGVEPGSIALEVEFETAGRCRLVDDGDGALVGFPDTVTPTTNVVDYDAGTIEFEADDAIVDTARLRYEFPNGWRMRVQRVTRHRNNVTKLDVVAVAERFAVVGSPVQINEPAYPVAVHPAQLRTAVLDIQSHIAFERPGLLYAACALAGSEWRGATVYHSTDGTNYVPRAILEQPSTLGVTTTTLSGTATPAVVDWKNTVTVQLDHGTLNDTDLDTAVAGLGQNWILVGDEIMVFLRATLNSDGTYTLSGLVRGLRDTTAAMATHATGERVVLLDLLGLHNVLEGGPGNGAFDTFVLAGEVGSERYVKIVPAGGILDDYPAQQITVQAQNVRPFAPAEVTQGDIVTYGYDWHPANPTYDPSVWLTGDVAVRWWRRSRSPFTPFGAGSAAPLLEAFERYEVEVVRNGTALAHRTRIVGGQNTGSQMVHRVFRYTLAEQTADAIASSDVMTIRVRQIGTHGKGGKAELSWVVP